MRRFSLPAGVTFDQIVLNLGAALILFNRSLLQGYYGQYMQLTVDNAVEYDTGGETLGLAEMSEYGRPDPIQGASTGHMIPMKDYGGALGWTYTALRRGTMRKLERDVKRLIERGENTWQRKVLTRLFTDSTEAVGTGTSVPFADGGTADAAYIPGNYGGRTFLNTHDHFAGAADSEAGRTASLLAMIAHLNEHGIPSPYELIVSGADEAVWRAQPEFSLPTRSFLTTAGIEVRATVDEANYIGLVEAGGGWARVKSEPRLPTKYAGLFKPFGFNNTNTPLVVRYESGYPLGLALVATIQQFPLQDAIAMMTFGIGIANRLAGAATFYDAGGTWVNPVIA
jgi:hypothetical protein